MLLNPFLLQPRATKNRPQVLENLDLPRNGWEQKLLLQCRRHMVVEPKRGSAVLFYNQHPDGRKDLVCVNYARFPYFFLFFFVQESFIPMSCCPARMGALEFAPNVL